MKFLHLADLHLGKVVNGFSMAADVKHVLQQAMDVAVDRHCDALLVAGDLYDKTAPSAEAVNLLDWFLTSSVEVGLQVFAIPGNHDSADRVGYVSSLLQKQGVHLAGPYEGKLEHFELEDDFGSVCIWLMPFIRPTDVRRFFPDEEIGQNYTAAVAAVLAGEDIDTSHRNVIVAHQFVTAPGQETLRSDSEFSLGGIDNVNAGVFDGFDYVALGHVHRPQRLMRDTLRYAGSPLKYSLSEISYGKSFPVVTLGEKGSVEVELVPAEPLHDMRKVKGPFEELLDPTVIAQGDTQDYLQVVLTDDDPPIDALARLRAVYPNIMHLDYDNIRTRAAQQAVPQQSVSASFEPMELFEQFYLQQNGVELTDAQRITVADLLGGDGQ